ncbi:DUF4124 domain-containing protein [Massilia sp. GCM10020059]|uniref:DUF4124 domain-containing protein n=1 Tax=Massilia agrisoli TaxID=2892444 RepID=A0ABS8ISV7_9BURK|nr:DUF4124 domain-containing protein [Massilia agrisoli]MCC6071026.1 DUF4124 domain-containing protein [Massilia agrisoli]
MRKSEQSFSMEIMQMNVLSPCVRLVAAATLMFVAGLAQAQYVWIDAKGIKQFSDRSPPSSVPDKNILKAPGRPVLTIAPGDQEQPAPVSVADAAKKALPTMAERNVEFNKRASDKAAADKKSAAEGQAKAARAEQCAAARDYKMQLDSGIRIGTVTPNGERAFMSDAERAVANAKTNKVLAACR